jgi:hypothetical protein
MTPKERMNMAMRLERPDRVPLMCQFSFGFINQQLKGSGISPMEMWLDAGKYVEGLMILRDRFDFDGILVSVHGHFEDWRSRINKIDSIQGIKIATFDNHRESYPDDDLPSAEFFNAPVKDIDNIPVQDIPDEISYIPSSKDCHAFIDLKDPFRVFDIIEDKVKGKYSIHGEVTSPFDYFLDLLGYEHALMALLHNPDKCKHLLQRYTNGMVRLAGDMCKKNIDAVKISSPFAGMGFISPDQYLEFEQPYIRQITNVISQSGKFSYIHTCGLINDRLEYMQETGTNGLECLDPPPIGNVELEDAFKRIGSKMFVKGNIDPVNTLFNGTEDSISTDVRKRLQTGMQNPGFILSTACSIAPKTPPGNVFLLRKLIDTYGYYV